MDTKYLINSNFNEYIEYFKEENNKINLVSKKEVEYIYEKHIYDSLSIKLFFEKYDYMPETLIDMGTGGGFPSFPIAIEFPQIEVTAADSIQKKINALSNINNKLKLGNLNLLCERVEKLTDKKFNIVTVRAVSELSNVFMLSHKLANDYMVIYKSKKVYDEIKNAEKLIKKKNFEIIDVIPYTLPINDSPIRNLVIIKNNN